MARMKLNELMQAIPVFTGEVSETIEISHITKIVEK